MTVRGLILMYPLGKYKFCVWHDSSNKTVRNAKENRIG
jgi:hypothetical protein